MEARFSGSSREGNSDSACVEIEKLRPWVAASSPRRLHALPQQARHEGRSQGLGIPLELGQ